MTLEFSNYDNEISHLNNVSAPLSHCEGDQTVKFSKMRQNLCEITQIDAKRSSQLSSEHKYGLCLDCYTLHQNVS